MDNLTKKVQKILIDKYGEGFDDGWFENGTLFKNIIKATEEALTIHSVVVPKGTLCDEMCCENEATHIAYTEHRYNCEKHRHA